MRCAVNTDGEAPNELHPQVSTPPLPGKEWSQHRAGCALHPPAAPNPACKAGVPRAELS